MKYATYNIALVNLLLQALGDGFTKTLFFFPDEKGGTVNNFKQKVRKMNRGSVKIADEIRILICNSMRRFVDGSVADELAKYCHKEAADKYYAFYWVLISNFGRAYSLSTAMNFFYETDEDVLAYLVAEWIVTSCYKGECPDKGPVHGNETKDFLEWQKESFRPEYYTVIYDVFTNSKGNKTFYKWVIDEFYNSINNKEIADKILNHIFVSNSETEKISTTFEKMKYEPGLRTWNTIDSLIQNEWNDKTLTEILKSDSECLRIYQIFQSRMLVAYLFENLKSILPNFIGKDNCKKLCDLISEKNSNPEEKFNLKETFLSADYETKTKTYEENVWELMHNDCFRHKGNLLSQLDTDCPATEFFENFIQLENWRSQCKPSEEKYNQILSKCREHIKYLGNFSHYNLYSNDILIF